MTESLCQNCNDTGYVIIPKYSQLWPKHTFIDVERCYEFHIDEIVQIVKEAMRLTPARMSFRGSKIPTATDIKEMATLAKIKDKHKVTSDKIASKATQWLAEKEIKEMAKLLMKLPTKQISIENLQDYILDFGMLTNTLPIENYPSTWINTETKGKIIESELIYDLPNLTITPHMPDNFIAMFYPNCGSITETENLKAHPDDNSIVFWYSAEYSINDPGQVELLQLNWP